jgi:hypothetical protein
MEIMESKHWREVIASAILIALQAEKVLSVRYAWCLSSLQQERTEMYQPMSLSYIHIISTRSSPVAAVSGILHTGGVHIAPPSPRPFLHITD